MTLTPTHPARLSPSPADHERRWALILSIIVVAITFVPYVVGFSNSNGRQFMWLGYNLDDSCVYLSWMRLAHDGAIRGYNLFTTDPQHGMVLNPLFLMLGVVARILHLPLVGVYQGSRLFLGTVLLAVVWGLIQELIPDPSTTLGSLQAAVPTELPADASQPIARRNRLARQLAYLFVCFSSGLGWLPLWWQENPPNTPIDKWQPEAITFLSLYLSPLFCFSLALQAGIVLLLLRADRYGRRRPAIVAGLCGFILGLVHTYDVLSLAIVWLTYLIVNTIRLNAKLPIAPTALKSLASSWTNALVAGAIASPAVVYIYWQLNTETVFQQRAAVQTLSPALTWVLTGYGFTLILALLAIYRLTVAHPTNQVDNQTAAAPVGIPDGINTATTRLLICWATANLAASYLPTTFQRKLLQGEHIPIAILAGIGAAWLLSETRLRRLPLWITVTAITLGLSITNIRFMLRDIDNYQLNLAMTRQHRPYLKSGEIAALRWIDSNVPRSEAVQPLPYLARDTSDVNSHKFAATDMTVACFTPGLTHHHVYCGHWGETPDYQGKLNEIAAFALPRMTNDQRIELLRKMKVRYLLYSQKDPNDEAADRYAPMFRHLVELPPYLKLVYQNDDADIYEVDRTIVTAPQNE